jgi:hypothetical protein
MGMFSMFMVPGVFKYVLARVYDGNGNEKLVLDLSLVQ